MNLWFSNTVSNLWSDIDNWFQDASLSAGGRVPTTGDICVLLADCTLDIAADNYTTISSGVTFTVTTTSITVDWVIEAGGEVIIPSGEVLTYAYSGGLYGFTVNGLITIEGEFSNNGLVTINYGGVMDISTTGIYNNKNDCNVFGSITNAGTVILGPLGASPPYGITYLLMIGGGSYIQNDATGSMEIGPNARFQFSDTASSANILVLATPAYW